ncbi:MAG: EAL and HDOD domain-containing protein, partial [Pontibacterium sp.]
MTNISPNDILMARQPIYDCHLNVVAYELLYRSSSSNSSGEGNAEFDGNIATSAVLESNFTSIYDRGEDRVLPAFVNLTEEMLSSNTLPNFDRNLVVWEVLEDVEVTQGVVDSIRRYRDAGYRVALDDFEYAPKFDTLLEMANIVKVDLTLTSGKALNELVATLKPFRVTLLAEKIETQKEFETCVALGFKLFQGYFLSRPKIIEGKKLEGNQLTFIEILSELDNPHASPESLEAIVLRDPELTLKMLRIVNSSQYSLAKKIDRLAQAIGLIGLDEVRKWVTLLSMSSQPERSSELNREVLITAHMCELIANNSDHLSPKTAFLAGMLSNLDVMLGVPKSK